MRIGEIVVVKTGVSGSLHLLEGRLKAAFQQNFQTTLGIFEHGNTKNSPPNPPLLDADRC